MSHTLRRIFFFVVIAAIVAALLLRAWGTALGLFSAAFAWLLWETHERQRFSFIARRACPETIAPLSGPIQGMAVSSNAPWALLVEAGPKASLLNLDDGGLRWTREFPGSALALLVRPDGSLLWASGESLHLTGPDGHDLAALPFEPPLYRQSYKLLLSADGKRAFLHTPWFIQAFDPDLGRLGPRLRYEDAGHYMKYAVLTADGGRLYTAGALLLDEEEGGAGMEARWDAWDLMDGRWENAWKQAYESYNNSHLRGLSLSANGQVLCAELYQTGYEFRLYRPDGSLLWKRAGERPVLSPDGSLLLWESAFDGVVLTRLQDQQKLYQHSFGGPLRLKAVADDGRCLAVAGHQLLRLDPQGKQEWLAVFKAEPDDLALGAEGRLVLTHGNVVGTLRLPWSG